MTRFESTRFAVRRVRGLVLPIAAGVSLVALAPPTLARQDGKPAAAPADGNDKAIRTLLAIDRGACSEMFPSAKDAGLRAAISMIGPRIDEILHTPGVAPGVDQAPEWIVPMVTEVITGPGRIAVTQQGFDDKTRMPKLGVVLSHLCPDAASAKAMNDHVEQLRQMSGAGFQPKPSKRFAGMQDITLPPGILSYGVRNAKDGSRFEIIFGSVEDPDGAFAGLPTSDQVQKPVLRAVADFAAATPVMEMFGGMAAMWAPNGEDLLQKVRDMGLMGPDAMSIEFVGGFGDGGSISTLTVRRAGKHADALGLVKATITDADLSVIPADAVAATIKKIDPSADWAHLKAIIGDNDHVNGMINQVSDQLGINIEQDLIAPLGNTCAMSVADSTGGNSLLAGVAFIEVKDRAKMAATIDKLSTKANDFIEHQMLEKSSEHGKTEPFGVKVVSTMADAKAFPGLNVSGVRFTQLKFQGLPIPMEPTFALTDRWLVVGATPQAVASAVSAAGQNKGGIKSNPAFAKYLGGGIGKATSLSLVDSSATMRDSYQMVLMGGQALGNFVRSYKSDVSRDAGMIVPTLPALREGSRPLVATTAWSGDDLVMTSRADESMLVNVAGLLGVADIGPTVAHMLVGAAIGAGAAKQDMEHARPAHRPRAQGEARDGHRKHGEDGDEEDADDEPDDANMQDAPPPPPPPAPEAEEAPVPPEPPAAPEAPAKPKRKTPY